MSNCSKKDNDQNKERGGCHTLFLFISYYFLLLLGLGAGQPGCASARPGPARGLASSPLINRSLQKIRSNTKLFFVFCQFFLFDYLYQAGPVHFQKSLARPEPQIPGPRPALAIFSVFVLFICHQAFGEPSLEQ